MEAFGVTQTYDFEEYPLHFGRMRCHLALVEAFLTARHVRDLQPIVVRVTEIQLDAVIAAVLLPANSEQVNWILFVMQPRYLKHT